MQFVLLRQSEPGAGLRFAFDTETSGEVLLGRDPSCQVPLDPSSDMVAAIFHARIQPDPKSPSGLMVIDLNSRSGTYVNGVPVRGQAALAPNSILTLGRRDGQTGPEFLVNIGAGGFQPASPPVREAEAAGTFDPPHFAPPPPARAAQPPRAPDAPVYAAPPAPPEPPGALGPSPAPMAHPVESPRMPDPPPYTPPPPAWGPEPVPAPVQGAAAWQPQPDAAAALAPGGAPPAGSPRNWWEDKLPGVESIQQAAQRAGNSGLPKHVDVRESKFRLRAAVIVAVSAIAVLFALYLIRQREPSTWSAPAIEEAYGNSILATELSWKLVDSGSGKQAFLWHPRLPFKPNDHRVAIFKGKERALVFVRMPDGGIEPVLVLASGAPDGQPAGGTTNGSAVAVDSGGFVLTGLRNAAPWTLPYEWGPGSFPAILIDPQTKQIDVIDRLTQNWMPLHARAVVSAPPTVEGLAGGSLSPVSVVLEGRSDLYRARLRDTTSWFPANPAATSEGSPLAVAKLQTNQSLAEVRIPEADPPLPLGQRVFVIGYIGPPESAQLKAAEFQVLKAETTSANGSDEFPLLAGSFSGIGQDGSAVFDSKGRLAGLLRVIVSNGGYQGEIVPIRNGRQLVRSDGTR